MDQYLLSVGAQALRTAALNEDAKAFVLANPQVYQLLKKAADRYIGGETLDETIAKIGLFQNQKCSIEFMGESTRTEAESNEATGEFIRIAERIRTLNLNATISLDLSHIGLAVSPELGYQNLMTICTEAAKSDIEVIISAEGTERTDVVLQTYLKVAKNYSNLAITLQAYLLRTKDDFAEVVKQSGRIRIVKGAFQTVEGLSLPRGEELDNVYLGYIEHLLQQNHKCSIATHDAKLQQAAKQLIQKYKPNNYEFESLLGICNEQLFELKDEGYPTKLYFVYGTEWYLYLLNRIAENPVNLFRALGDIVN